MTEIADLQATLAMLLPPPDANGESLLNAWRAARDDSLEAYHAWRVALRDHADDAYAAYKAADEREAAAAEALGRWVAQRVAEHSANARPGGSEPLGELGR